MTRHNRRAEFDAAIGRHSRRWPEDVDDPNDPAALAHRARVLASAWRPPVADRVGFLVDRVRGRRLLDVGCVAHDERRMDRPAWLHRSLAEAATESLGVDILESGVEAMRARGFDAVVADLSTDATSLAAEWGRFEVIIAGELIEHVDDLGMLFGAAGDLLASGGELILTTPNPYAPERVWAGSAVSSGRTPTTSPTSSRPEWRSWPSATA